MRDYKKYEVWQDGVQVAIDLYQLTNKFPEQEKFGLTNQLRRSVVSIPSNIAEGSSRSSTKDFSRFLEISQGSCFEAETQLLIASRLGFLEMDQYESITIRLDSISKQISGLKRKLKT